jgi:hypothetical protein
MSREHYENLPSADLAKMIRTAMGEGCIRPVHVYDMVDVLLSRIEEPAGDGAAMREALAYCCKILNRSERQQAAGRVEAALAKPPRNCDRFHTGDVKADAQAAMEAILDEGVAGYRGIAEYLLSPVAGKRKAEEQPELPRPATEEEVEAGDAQWCEVCHTTCPFKGKDILVHGCGRANPKDSLS